MKWGFFRHSQFVDHQHQKQKIACKKSENDSTRFHSKNKSRSERNGGEEMKRRKIFIISLFQMGQIKEKRKKKNKILEFSLKLFLSPTFSSLFYFAQTYLTHSCKYHLKTSSAKDFDSTRLDLNPFAFSSFFFQLEKINKTTPMKSFVMFWLFWHFVYQLNGIAKMISYGYK